jgi:hypothetical protein
MATSRSGSKPSTPRAATPSKRAKEKRAVEGDSHDDPDKIAKCHKMLHKLREYHALGIRLNESSESTVQFSRVIGVHTSTLYKAREFARKYDQSQLAQLCCLRREKSKLPLHWGYVPLLLTVSDLEERSKLEGKAAAGSWSVNRLAEEIRRRFRKKGRRKTKPGKKLGRPPGAARVRLSEQFEEISSMLHKMAGNPKRSKSDKRTIRVIQMQLRQLKDQLRQFALS